MKTANTRCDSPERISIRTERFRYYFWGSIGLGVILVGIKNAVENPSHWIGLIVLFLAWSILFSWLAAYRIIIDRNILSYSALIKGTVSVCRDDIASAEMPSGRFEHTIVINRRLDRPIVINTKPFSKSDLRIVIRFLDDKILNKPDWA